MNKNVSKERLLHHAEYFNKQEGQRYPCSNQIVCCGVVTRDREKALRIMAEKGATLLITSRHRLIWELNSERWIWQFWSENSRGYRFYKIMIDDTITNKLFDYVIRPCCHLYCCSMEVI